MLGAAFSSLKSKLLANKLWKDSYLEEYGIDKLEFENKKKEILQSYADKNREACEHGTKVHEKMENLMYQKDADRFKKYGIGGQFSVEKGHYKFDKELAVYPEMLISYSPDKYLRVSGQADLIIKDGDEIQVLDYKGLPIDTQIPTPDGFKMMSELKVGDIVFDKDGKQTTIINKSKIHYNPCYKIVFDNNEKIIADKDHRWEISFIKNKVQVSHIFTTEELYYYIKNTAKRESWNIPKIYNPKPIDIDDVDLPVDPYVLGAWLGDGSKVSGNITQSVGSKVWDELKSRGYELGPDVTMFADNKDATETRYIYGLSSQLRMLGILNKKGIPDKYIFASYKQRLDLLRGIMDTNGYYNPKRKRFVMGTSQAWQVYDLRKLLGTFGIKSTIFKVTKTCNGKKFSAYDLCFSTKDFNPFLTRNQSIDIGDTNDKSSFRNIVSVEPIDMVPTQCIEVNSKTHTYLCTESFLVTHNTNASIDKESYFDKTKKKRQMLKFPLDNIQDCNFWIYTLQLSLYMYMIQQMNPKFKCKKLALIHIDRDGNETEYECPYLKEDIARMLLHYRRENKMKMELDKDKPIVF